jgi:hypothetical protein
LARCVSQHEPTNFLEREKRPKLVQSPSGVARATLRLIMANASTGTLHGATITLDAPMPALDGHRVRVLIEDAGERAPATSAADAVRAALADLGAVGGRDRGRAARTPHERARRRVAA